MALNPQILANACAPPAPPPRTARVVRSDASGVWVAPLGSDQRHPIGPCRGAVDIAGNPLQAGVVVLLVNTSHGPWVAGYEEL